MEAAKAHICVSLHPQSRFWRLLCFGSILQAWWITWCLPVTRRSRGTLSLFSCRPSSGLPIQLQPSSLQKMGLLQGKLVQTPLCAQLLSQMTQHQTGPQGHTWWKGRTDYCKVSSDLHMRTVLHTHTHTHGKNNNKFLLHVCRYFACVWVSICTAHACLVPMGAREGLEPLELELLIIMTYVLDVGN